MSTERPPARDWATDFDHLDPRWSNDPYPIWADLRGTCPIAHTERFQGCYFPSTYGATRAIAHDTVHFSSRRIIVRDVRIEPIPAPPITSDPPEHKPWKQALLPFFTADALAPLAPRARATCEALIDAFPAGGCDVADAYTRHIPVRVIAHMLGLPESDGDLFRRWIHQILELGIGDSAVLLAAMGEMHGYFIDQIARRRAAPGDDLISRLLTLTIEGKPARASNSCDGG